MSLRGERRRYPRWKLNRETTLTFAGSGYVCLVKDISAGGLAVDFKNPPTHGTNAVAYISGIGAFNAKVAHVTGEHVGFRFVIGTGKQKVLCDQLAGICANHDLEPEPKAGTAFWPASVRVS